MFNVNLIGSDLMRVTSLSGRADISDKSHGWGRGIFWQIAGCWQSNQGASRYLGKDLGWTRFTFTWLVFYLENKNGL